MVIDINKAAIQVELNNTKIVAAKNKQFLFDTAKRMGINAKEKEKDA